MNRTSKLSLVAVAVSFVCLSMPTVDAAKYEVVTSTKAIVARDTLESLDLSVITGTQDASTEMYTPDKMNSIVENLSLEYVVKQKDKCQFTSDIEDRARLVKSPVFMYAWGEMLLKGICVQQDKDLALGSWFIGCSVDNDEVWETIKSGKWNGFSIEAMVVMDEINLHKQDTNMTDVKLETVEITESFWSKLKSIIAEALGKEESAPEVEEADEEVKSEVIEEPIEVVEEMAEETPIEEPVVEEEIAAEEIVAEVIDIVEDPQTTEEEKENELQAVVDDLTEKLKQKDAEIAEMQKQIEKLSKQPSTEPIKVEASKQTKVGVLDIMKWKY